MGIVGGVDEVDVVGALGDEILTDLPQALHGDSFSKILMADLLVLTEHTAKTAAGKKHRSRSPCAGDGGFLPLVEGRTGQHGHFRHTAVAFPGGFGS